MTRDAASRTAIQASRELWDALEHLRDVSKELLSPVDAEKIEAPLRKGASECLHRLVTPGEEPDEVELQALRRRLKVLSRS